MEEQLSLRLEELENVLNEVELPPPNPSLERINEHLLRGYNQYLVNSRERGTTMVGDDLAGIGGDDLADIINDNVQLSTYNFEILQAILISLKNANAEISTLKQEIRLRRGGNAKKYTKRFRKK
jgi:hypothetical protein